MDPEPVFVEHDGLRIAALDWGGTGPPLLLLHPNGFCAGLFDPLAELLVDDYRPIGVDLRGHGASDAPASRDQCRYVDAASDVLAVLEQLGLTEVLALGESVGGAATVLLDELRPGIVRRALLCEAIAWSAFDRATNPAASVGDTEGNARAAAARRRRVVWPDRPTVEQSYGSRPPLNALEPAALAAYVRWGFRDRADGQIELACPPEVEAWYFEGSQEPDGAARAFAHLPSLTATAVVVGAHGSDLPDTMAAAQAEAAGAPLVMVDGSHFFLQEDSERAAALVRRHLRW